MHATWGAFVSSELPLTARASRYVRDSLHRASVRNAFENPVSKDPTDDSLAVVGSVLGRKRGTVQQWTGADGTYIRVVLSKHGPVRIIHVSPPGGQP